MLAKTSLSVTFCRQLQTFADCFKFRNKVGLDVAIEALRDGLVFSPETIKAKQIKEDAGYQGIRLRIEFRLENARLTLQIDSVESIPEER